MGDRPNKSQSKREMNELLGIARRLAEVDSAQLRTAGLGEEVVEAVEHLATLHHRGSRLRQLRFLRGLLSTEDLGPILRIFEEEAQQGERERESFHRLEGWRDRLIADDQTVWDELRRELPGFDRQRLRTLARNARKEVAAGQSPRAARALFRALRETGGD